MFFIDIVSLSSITKYYTLIMKKLMTKHFSKWALKQKLSQESLFLALTEVQSGNFEASLGGNIYKKRIINSNKQWRHY